MALPSMLPPSLLKVTLQLRASNEGFLKPRVARARESTLALLASVFRQLDRPRPLPFGQRHFLKPTVRPLKLADHIDLHNKGVCLVRQPTEPIPAGRTRLLTGPLILGHASVSFSPLS